MARSVVDLVRDIEPMIIAYRQDWQTLTSLVTPLLGLLMEHEALLTSCSEALATRKRVLLHRGAEGAYSISACIFPPGRATPVHDHGCWGLVGVWLGQEQEERFERLDNSRQPGRSKLQQVRETAHGPGSVSILLPPHDIHRVRNATREPAYSIHIYGHPAMTPQIFDLETDAVFTGRSDPLAAAVAWGREISLGRLLGLPDAPKERLIDEARERLIGAAGGRPGTRSA